MEVPIGDDFHTNGKEFEQIVLLEALSLVSILSTRNIVSSSDYRIIQHLFGYFITNFI